MMLSYLDEAGLRFGDFPITEVRDAIDDLVDASDTIRTHEDERLLWSLDAYEFEVEPGRKLVEFLYEPGVTVPLYDARRRLVVLLDRLSLWPDSEWEIEVDDYEVNVGTDKYLAPSLAQAVAAGANAGPVAVVALATARAAGPFDATVGKKSATLHAIASPRDRPGFVRSWLLASKPAPSSFEVYLDRAFPKLAWANDARNGLRVNSNVFFGDTFSTTIHHLSVLNDHGAELFATCSENPERKARLSAEHHVDASPESPNTRASQVARNERLGRWNGEPVYFWWHTKILWDSGRIHFHHDPVATVDAPSGQIVIGFCVNHLAT